MPRPRKCRRVCAYPETLAFGPVGSRKKKGINLTVDEYEVIRLIDKEGFSQEECGEQMGISRTTVQLVYASARKKIAEALVDGLTLRIQGGDYQLCGGDTAYAGCRGCGRQKIYERYAKQKGDHTMRIAVTYEDGEIFQHFGHTETFKVYDIEEGKVLSSEVVDTNGQGHGALAGVLRALHADVLICGGIGGGARTALEEAGIRLYGGVSGEADKAVEAFLKGELSYDPEAHCDHHGHGGEQHDCAGHGDNCGGHGHSCHA